MSRNRVDDGERVAGVDDNRILNSYGLAKKFKKKKDSLIYSLASYMGQESKRKLLDQSLISGMDSVTKCPDPD